MDPAAAICISDTYKGPVFTLLGLCTCPFSNSPLLRGCGIIYGLGLGVRGPFWGTLVPWLLPLNIPGLEKLGYEGIAVDVPWVSWGNVEGNAVFKGDVTKLAAEVRTLFLWSPVEAFALDFKGGLPTFLLGSSPPLLAGRFLGTLFAGGCFGALLATGCFGTLLAAGCFGTLLAAGCFGVCLGVLVTGDIITSIGFVISGKRTLVAVWEISCKWVVTVLGIISGTSTEDDIALGEVMSFVDNTGPALSIWTGSVGNCTKPGKGDCRGLPLEMLAGFCVSGVVFASGESVDAFTVEGFLPLCFGVEGWLDEPEVPFSGRVDCSVDAAAAPVESLGLGGFFSFSLSVLFLGFSFSFSFSLSTLSFSLLSFSFSLSVIFPGLSVGLVLKRMPLACKGITKLIYYQQQIQLNPSLRTPAGFQYSFPFGGRGMGKYCTCIFGNHSCIKELSGVCSSRAWWPLAPNFCPRATRKSQIFHTNHML